jgi:putative ATPase
MIERIISSPGNFFPKALKNTKFYDPGNNARENELRKFLKERWKGKYGY